LYVAVKNALKSSISEEPVVAVQIKKKSVSKLNLASNDEMSSNISLQCKKLYFKFM